MKNKSSRAKGVNAAAWFYSSAGFGSSSPSFVAAPKPDQPHVAEFDSWMVNPLDRDFIADPAQRWCRVCGSVHAAEGK